MQIVWVLKLHVFQNSGGALPQSTSQEKSLMRGVEENDEIALKLHIDYVSLFLCIGKLVPDQPTRHVIPWIHEGRPRLFGVGGGVD